MAERPSRLIVFYGSEEERLYWARRKQWDPKRVLLAKSAYRLLQGRNEPIDVVICSGRHGLGGHEAQMLRVQIRTINNTFDRKT